MTNQNYWAKRTAEREAHWHELTTAELTKLRRYYKAAHKELEREAATLYAKYATENGLTITEARKLIRGDEFKEWRMSLREYVAAAKGDPKLLRELNTLAMRSRISRVEAIHARTLTELIELGNRLQDTTDEHLYRAYLDNYYGTLYDFHKTVGLNTPPAAVARPRVESVLQTKWSGKNYSARIWTNTRKLATELQSTITQAIHRGYSIERLSKNLAQRMNVAYTNAERLILTELNAVETRASADAMKAADFDYYQFVATLDRRTCPICGERDGEVYPLSSMNQGENAPPMHPRCRCTIIAHMEGVGKGERVAGRTRVSADVSYRQWLKSVAGVGKITVPTPQIKIANYEDVAAARPAAEFMTFAERIKPTIELYTGRVSKWNGRLDFTAVDGKGGGKLWDCSIRLNPDAPEHVLIHELIHSCSASHFGAAMYATHRFEEELTVHFLSQELAIVNNSSVVDSLYDSGVELIREFKALLGVRKSDLEFAAQLIRQPLGERWDWLASMIDTNVTIGQYLTLLDKLEAIKKWTTMD